MTKQNHSQRREPRWSSLLFTLLCHGAIKNGLAQMTKPNQTNDGLVSFLQLLVPRCHQKSVLGHTTTKPNLECPRRHQPWTGHRHCNASVSMYSLICILASLQCQHRSPVFHFYRLELRVISFAGFARQVVYHNRCKMSHYIMTHTVSHRCDGYIRLKSDKILLWGVTDDFNVFSV